MEPEAPVRPLDHLMRGAIAHAAAMQLHASGIEPPRPMGQPESPKRGRRKSPPDRAPKGGKE